MADDEVYDPYDISKYQNPVNQNATDDSDTNNLEGQKPFKKEKNVFNPYEDTNEEKENKDDEKTKLKPKLKTQNEEFSENIDLSKNAYEENDSKDNENKDNNNEEDEEELPLLEELGINPQNIKNKIMGVITLKRIDKQFLKDSDMAGPLLIIMLFAFSLVLQYKINFGYIYGISLFGSVLIFLLLNLMSKGNNSILLYNTMSVLGYCLIPIVLLSFFAVFLDMKNIFGEVLSLIAIVLSSLNASRFFEIGLDMSSQRWLIFYPVALFYTCFVLVTIY
jgi:hypothetical protein